MNLIYALYVDDLLGGGKICQFLDQHGILSPRGVKWSVSTVSAILKSETYVGTMVYNKIGRVPGTDKKIRNPESEWIKCEGAFIPIVDKDLFYQAKKIREERRKIYTNEELLTMLRGLYQNRRAWGRC